jgi:hypothetical protein
MWIGLAVIGMTVLGLAGLFSWYDRSEVIRMIGAFPLELRVTARPEHNISQIAAGTQNGPKGLIDDLRRGVFPPDCRFRPLDWPRELFVELNVTWVARQSVLGRELSYAEDGILVLRLRMANGETEYRYFEVPPGRGRRSMTVEVP